MAHKTQGKGEYARPAICIGLLLSNTRACWNLVFQPLAVDAHKRTILLYESRRMWGGAPGVVRSSGLEVSF